VSAALASHGVTPEPWNAYRCAVATTRLAAFSDGVLAIAATLLILDVRATGEPLGHDLLQIWPRYVAYATSFTTIGIIWVNHHTVIDQIGHVDRRFLFINRWAYAGRGARLLRPDADPQVVAGITRSFRPGIPLYLSSTLIAFASPAVSVSLYVALAALYVLESSVFARSGDRP
jgi:hypothetical protein